MKYVNFSFQQNLNSHLHLITLFFIDLFFVQLLQVHLFFHLIYIIFPRRLFFYLVLLNHYLKYYQLAQEGLVILLVLVLLITYITLSFQDNINEYFDLIVFFPFFSFDVKGHIIFFISQQVNSYHLPQNHNFVKVYSAFTLNIYLYQLIYLQHK